MGSFQPLFPALLDLVPKQLLLEEDKAFAAYDFVCVPPMGTIRMAELLGFENGLIHSIEMFFDPRPLLNVSQT